MLQYIYIVHLNNNHTSHHILCGQQTHSAAQPHPGEEDADIVVSYVQEGWLENKPMVNEGDGMYPWVHLGEASRGGI